MGGQQELMLSDFHNFLYLENELFQSVWWITIYKEDAIGQNILLKAISFYKMLKNHNFRHTFPSIENTLKY